MRGARVLDFGNLVGDLQNLFERLLDLTGRLCMNAITPARLDIEIAVLGKLERSHERIEIRVLARFKQFTRFFDMLVVTAKPHQQISPAYQRRAKRSSRHT